jgi:hypothetical protein
MVTFDIFPVGAAWRVQSRGFVWDFAQDVQAVDFASDMAEHYAHACNQPTNVRFRDDTGDPHELRRFDVAPWVPPHDGGDARQATLLPFRRKGH